MPGAAIRPLSQLGAAAVRISQTGIILAIITTRDRSVSSGGPPVFLVATRDAAQRKATTMARILNAMVHDVGDDTFILVRH